jgi:predicted glycosyltransferase
MNILIDMGHPAHVHFYKNAIIELKKRGHDVLISARIKDVTRELLDYYNFPYIILSKIGSGRFGLYKEFLEREVAMLRLLHEYKPDVVTEIEGVFIAPVCKLLKIPSVVFTDTEHARIDRYLTYPFADLIVTPDCFKKEINSRQIRYAGFHELAYLHPDYFIPDPAVIKKVNILPNEPFIVLRFVAWKASHDKGQYGFSKSFKMKLVQELRRFGKVLITSEDPLPPEFEPYQITLPPAEIHHLLSFASLYLGEGATMATEAAILGTPSVYLSSLVGLMGNFEELENRYQLVFSFTNQEKAYQKSIDILENKDSKAQWHQRRIRLLADKIKVTQYICNILENYPEFMNPGRTFN